MVHQANKNVAAALVIMWLADSLLSGRASVILTIAVAAYTSAAFYPGTLPEVAEKNAVVAPNQLRNVSIQTEQQRDTKCTMCGCEPKMSDDTYQAMLNHLRNQS